MAHGAVAWLALIILILSAPAPATADRGQHGGHRSHRGVAHGHKFHHMPHHRFPPRPHAFRHPGFAYRAPFVFGGGFYGGGYYAQSMPYDSTPVYNPPAVYNPPPVYMSVAVAPAAPWPSRPSVIEYPTGRYELRGDGFSTPYTWVWIPNPPPPPPAEEPEPQPPPASRSAPSSPPVSAEAPVPRKSQLYRWVDGQGVVHLTDNLDNVPEPYRKPAARTRPY